MAKLIRVKRCEDFVESWWRDGDQVWKVREDRHRAKILAQNAELRKSNGVRTLDGMKWALQIPQDDYSMLAKAMPELVSKDGAERHKAWQEFMVSSLSLPYRVNDTARGRTA